jgi:hypothetical protein
MSYCARFQDKVSAYGGSDCVSFYVKGVPVDDFKYGETRRGFDVGDLSGLLGRPVKKLRSGVHGFFFTSWTSPLFIGLNLRPWNDSKRIAVSLLHQRSFNSGVSESVPAVGTRHHPAWHFIPFLAVGTSRGSVLAHWQASTYIAIH